MSWKRIAGDVGLSVGLAALAALQEALLRHIAASKEASNVEDDVRPAN